MGASKMPTYVMGEWVMYVAAYNNKVFTRRFNSVSEIKDMNYDYDINDWVYWMSNGDHVAEQSVVKKVRG